MLDLLILAFALVSLTISDTVEYKWTVSQFKANLDGFERLVIGINNKPGYLNKIEVNSGDTIRVILTNNLSEATGIHWHGIHHRKSPFADGAVGVTQCPIPPGKTFTYEFSCEGQAGTFWWHSHFKGQYIDGLRGSQ